MSRSGWTEIICIVICILNAIVWASNINDPNESSKGEAQNLPTVLNVTESEEMNGLVQVKLEQVPEYSKKEQERLWLIPSFLSLFTTPPPPPPPSTVSPAIIFINLPPYPGTNENSTSTSTSTSTAAPNSTSSTSTTTTSTTPDYGHITSTPFPILCTSDDDCKFILNGKYCKPNGICGCRSNTDCDATSFGTNCNLEYGTCSCNLAQPQTCAGRFNGPNCLASIFGSTGGTGVIWNGCGCDGDDACRDVASFGPHCIDNKCKCQNGANHECATSGLGRVCFYNGCGCDTNIHCSSTTFGPTCTNNICRCASDADCVGNSHGSRCDLTSTLSDTYQQCTYPLKLEQIGNSSLISIHNEE